MDDFKNEYLNAINGKQYDKLIEILIKNLIHNINCKSMCDLGTYMCDSDSSGLTVRLSEKQCKELGKNLLLCSYYSHPDVKNALALQLVCLERDNDFQTVADMAETASLVNNGSVFNNIAYSEFELGNVSTALSLQRNAANMNLKNSDNGIIVDYNLLLYELYFNNDVKRLKEKHNWEVIRSALIGDDVFDYESAMIMSLIFEDYDFIKHNYDFFTKTFVCDKNIITMLNEYLKAKVAPDMAIALNLLHPKTCYENNFYLTE